MESFPVPANRAAEERAQARAFGLPSSSGRTMAPQAMDAAVVPDAPIVTNAKFGRGKIIDASEGTSLDPLRDRSYDLNSAKTVPVLKALPPIPVMSYAN